jgi:hypothetical protein
VANPRAAKSCSGISSRTARSPTPSRASTTATATAR